MPMTAEIAAWWSKHKLAYISLAISLVEVLVIGGVLVSIQMSKQPPTPHLVGLTDTTWLMSGLGSFGFAVVGLVADSDRRMAFFALIVATVVSLICGFPLMASA
jgi:hypothetical protein